MKLSFKILGIPFSKQSARFTSANGSVRSYQPKKLIISENNVRFQILSQLSKGFKCLNEPLRITKAHFIYAPLKTFSKKVMKEIAEGAIIYKDTSPDLDSNLMKGTVDAMEGIVFINDSRICEINNVKKFYGITPRIEIDIETLN
jgi:Holliday junction resolvase RusA-like endonuclease